MTDSISIYEKYNIDLNRLSRDYLKFPLKRIPNTSGWRYELPLKEDLEYLHLELNLSIKIIQKIFNVSGYCINTWNKRYNIHKSRELITKCKENTNIRLYGVKNTLQNKEIKQKAIDTIIKKYGCEHVMKCKEIKQKAYVAQIKTKSTKEHHEKMVNLWKNKTNEQKKEILNKIKNTCKERFGEDNIFKTKFIKDKIWKKHNRLHNNQINIQNYENLNEQYIRNHFIKDGLFLLYKCMSYFNICRGTAINYKEKFNISEQNESKNLIEQKLFFKYLNILDIDYKFKIKLDNKKYFKPDGYDPETNTVYEFLGDYWHGNLTIYDPNNKNINCNKTFKELNGETFKRFDIIKSLGYNIIYIWESDFIINGKIQENWKEKMKEY